MWKILTKHLLNTGRNSDFQKGKKRKKKKSKELGQSQLSWEEAVKEEMFPHTVKAPHWQ